MKKPKILTLTSSFPRWEGDYNGIFIYELAIRLKEKFQVFVLSPAFNNSNKVEYLDGIKLFKYKQFPIKGIELADGNPIMSKLKKKKHFWLTVPFFLISQFVCLIKIIRREEISIIHAHWIIPQGLIAVVYKKLINKKIKIVASIHGTDINDFKGFLGKRLIKYVLNYIDELTVVSNSFKNKIVKLGYGKKIFVFPTNIDTQLFNPGRKDETLKERLGINGEFILFVGSLVKNKGVHLLIEAMPKIIIAFPNAKLVVVGNGQLKQDLVKTSKKLGITNSVIFTGIVSNKQIPSYYATADLFVLPSFSEGLGGVITEALSCETLVLASPLKAFKDRIIENKTGFYLKEITSEKISSKIIHILKNKEKFKPISETGRTYIVNNFDWKNVGENYNKLFLNLLLSDKQLTLSKNL